MESPEQQPSTRCTAVSPRWRCSIPTGNTRGIPFFVSGEMVGRTVRTGKKKTRRISRRANHGGRVGWDEYTEAKVEETAGKAHTYTERSIHLYGQNDSCSRTFDLYQTDHSVLGNPKISYTLDNEFYCQKMYCVQYGIYGICCNRRNSRYVLLLQSTLLFCSISSFFYFSSSASVSVLSIMVGTSRLWITIMPGSLGD